MLQNSSFEIKPYLNLAIRRKWWIIIPFTLSILGGLGIISITPNIYKASTLILLEPQSIPDSFVRSTVSESMEGRLRTISQQIHSRTNLESIIRDFGIDQNLPKGRKQAALELLESHIPAVQKVIPRSTSEESETQQRIQMLNAVDHLRNSIQVAMRGGGGGRGQTQAFEISMQWHDPEIIAAVTNIIAARFIEENLSVREEMAVSTTDFLESETSTLRSELEKKEQELEAFKTQHMGMLPDQLNSNISILNQLRGELSNLERRLEHENQQVLFLRSQAAFTRSERENAAAANREDALRGGIFTSGSITELERELSRLSTLYTERHPDILTLKRRIETLKTQQQDGPITQAGASLRPNEDRVSLQLATALANIDSYNRAIKDLERQIDTYKWRIEQTAQIEMEQNKILRDYETLRRRYDGLLSNKLDAKLAEQLERRRKGEQFRILDAAIKPSRPSSPDPRRIMFMALALGLGLGCGLAYVREMLDARFYSPDDVQALLEAPVIVSLPLLKAENKS